MARGINKVIIVGNLGNDPEVRYANNGNAIANLSLATSETWKDKNTGENQEKTEWHRVVMFGRLGEIAGEYLKKGSQIYIEGKLQTRKWQDQSGNDKYTTEIVANEMQMLGGRNEMGAGGGSYAPSGQQKQQPAGGGFQQQPAQQQQQAPQQQSSPAAPAQPAPSQDFDDDIPF